jgi:cytosine/adenosine deaminase-related metal-dependent hydrolase
VGKRADLVLLDTASPSMVPRHDPVSTIVYQASGGEVDTVIVDGEVLLDNRVLTRLPPEMEEELKREAQRRSVDILRRSGLPC